MFRNLFDKCVKLASSKLANYALALVSFVESFFFPVPPDLMIIPMVVAKKESYFKIFLIATIFSVLGGLVGYMLGVFFLDTSMIIIEFYGYEERVFEIQDKILPIRIQRPNTHQKYCSAENTLLLPRRPRLRPSQRSEANVISTQRF